MCLCGWEYLNHPLLVCKPLFHEFFIFCLGFGLFIGHHKTSKGVNLSFRKLWSVFCLLFGHFINRIGKKNTQVKRNLRLLTASLDQRRHRGQKPPSSSPILSPSPSSTMTGGLVVVLVLEGRGGPECVKRRPLSPFTGLDLGVAVRSGGVRGVGLLSMWSAGIYIWSLDIDQGSASACWHSEALETLWGKKSLRVCLQLCRKFGLAGD